MENNIWLCSVISAGSYFCNRRFISKIKEYQGKFRVQLSTNSMEQSPSKLITAQLVKFPACLWNPKIHYRFNKNTPLAPVLSQMDPVHTLPLYFFKINVNVIFSPMPRPSKWSLPFRSSDQNFVSISHLPTISSSLILSP
jgi:hypothetical protein